MLRLLIIDDEPYIVDWVYGLFDHNDLFDFDIQKAYSGTEALDYMKRARIDIVLTDICMPGMDGILLLQEIRSNWPDCRVIFLTAHDEFEYAHIANKDGVAYILKTESDEVILQTVKRVAAEIEQTRWRQEILERAQRQIDLYRPVLQREYLHGLLFGQEEETVSQEQFDELGISLGASQQVLFLLAQTIRENGVARILDKAHDAAAIDAIVDGCFPSELKRFAIRLENGTAIWLLQPSEGKMEIGTEPAWEWTMMMMKGALETLQDKFGHSTHSSSVFVVDNRPCLWKEASGRLPELLAFLAQSCPRDIGTTVTRLLPPRNASPKETLQNGQLRTVSHWLEQIGNLKSLLETGQNESFMTLFSQLQATLLPIVIDSPAIWQEVSMSISAMFLAYLNRNGRIRETLSQKGDLPDLAAMGSVRNPEQAFPDYRRLSEIVFSLQASEQISKEERLVLELHEHIKNHLNGDLSLVRLAEIAYMSPAYLSRSYKQITGNNLSDHIQQQRMERAIHLLSDTMERIYGIAEDVGFDSVGYFIRSFKKAMGMTPQEYRNRTMSERIDNRRQ